MPTFLEEVFGGKPDELYLLLWTLLGQRSYWYQDLAMADRHVRDSTKSDLYVGVGLSPKDHGPKKRGLADQIAGIPGLWADIDIVGPAHKKKNLPPTIEDAQKFLAEDIPLKPSVLVHSGHGLQVWWLFSEPWIFESDEQRLAATELSRRWTHTLKVWARKRGWDIDSTWDLTRVLRIPGTMNTKVKNEPVPVRVLEQSPVRYGWLDDFSAYLAEDTLGSVSERATRIEGALVLDAIAEPPHDKWDALMQAEPRFQRSWEHTRKELQDQSASSYDMSLATFAAAAGWADQEIANLLIAWRRKHGEDLKLRQDYYARTIARARDGAAKMVAAEALEDAVNLNAGEAMSPEGRADRLEHLSVWLGYRILGGTKYLTTEPVYYLATPRGRHKMGGTDVLVSQTKFRTAFAAATGYRIPEISKGRWHTVSQTLLDIMVEEDPGAESTESGYTLQALQDYLAAEPLRGEATADLFTWKRPYRGNDGFVYLFLSDFQTWLTSARHDKISSAALGVRLRELEAQPTHAHLGANGTRSSRSVFRLPRELTDPPVAPAGGSPEV